MSTSSMFFFSPPRRLLLHRQTISAAYLGAGWPSRCHRELAPPSVLPSPRPHARISLLPCLEFALAPPGVRLDPPLLLSPPARGNRGRTFDSWLSSPIFSYSEQRSLLPNSAPSSYGALRLSHLNLDTSLHGKKKGTKSLLLTPSLAPPSFN